MSSPREVKASEPKDEKAQVERITKLLEDALKDHQHFEEKPALLDEAMLKAQEACGLALELKQFNPQLAYKFNECFCDFPYSVPNDLLITLLSRSIDLCDERTSNYYEVCSLPNTYLNLIDFYFHIRKIDDALETTLKLMELLKKFPTNVSPTYNTIIYLGNLNLEKLAENFLELVVKLDSEILPTAAKLKNWILVNSILVKYRDKINIDAVFRRDRKDVELEVKVSALGFALEHGNKSLAKYLMLLGAKQDEAHLQLNCLVGDAKKNAITCRDTCNAEIQKFLAGARLLMNKRGCIPMFREFKLDKVKIGDVKAEQPLSATTDTSIELPQTIREDILMFALDPDLKELMLVGEPKIKELRKKQLLDVIENYKPQTPAIVDAKGDAKSVMPSSSNFKTASLAVREYRANFKGVLFPSFCRDKKDLINRVLDQFFKENSVDVVRGRFIYQNLAYLAKKEEAEKSQYLTKDNIKNLLSIAELSIKEIVENAAGKASQSVGKLSILDKRYETLQLSVMQVFSKEEYAGLWAQEDVMQQCAEKMAALMSTKELLSVNAIRKCLEPVLDAAALKEVSKGRSQLLKTLRANRSNMHNQQPDSCNA